MQIFGVEISTKVFEFFRENLNDNDLYSTNKLLNTKSGIVSFFNSQNDIYDLIRQIENMQSSEPEPDRTEYGDFQTPLNLCDRTCKLLQDKQIKPKIIIFNSHVSQFRYRAIELVVEIAIYEACLF